jgi:pimeloyl-ACP methyl ester carboxylesterase
MFVAGCAPFGTAMVSAPNRNRAWAAKFPAPSLERLAGVDDYFQVAVGPPSATLAVSIVEPPPETPRPRGTVLVLHGIFGRSVLMLDNARALAAAGYRAVAVDLRGHGRSTGDWLTYGVQEARDLSQVIDELQRRRLIAGPLGVYGISYGAATSIHLAGRDPRVAAVVAVAPFTAMRDEVPTYIRTLLPGVGATFSDNAYQRAIDAAGVRAGFDPDEADSALAVAQTRARVLVLHGTDDWLVPPTNAARLQAAAPDRVETAILPDLGHVTIGIDRDGEVQERTLAWFNRWLGGAEAPIAERSVAAEVAPLRR